MARMAGGVGSGGDLAGRRPLPATALMLVLLCGYLVAVYGAVVVLGDPVGADAGTARSILATAIVAVTFERARSAAGYLANRVFFGARATPMEAATLLSEHLVTAPDEELMKKLAEVVAKATGAQCVRVSVLENAESREVAVHGRDEGEGLVHRAGREVARVPVRDRGELLGEITVVRRRGARAMPTDQDVVRDLAALAASSFRNLHLRAELRGRVDELTERTRALRISRRQMLEAQFDERRRLERDIHDGGQQYLTALGIKLTHARLVALKRPEQFPASVDDLQALAGEALEATRELGDRLHPATLAKHGVIAALAEAAPRFPFAVEVSGPHTRYPKALEAAIYLTCIEALQNSAKHALAAHVRIGVEDGEGSVSFTVQDDGVGFDVDGASQRPPLRAVGERVAAFGGTLEVRSSPGAGTRVAVWLPMERAEEEVVAR